MGRTIKVEQLTVEAFREFGSYSQMLNPTGYCLGQSPARFFRDRVVANYDPTSLVSFCVSVVDPRPLTVERTETHLNTCEVIMPMDGDVVMHVGPARKEPDYSEFRAFLVPKGTVFCMRPGVFHASPIAAGDQSVLVLLVLPELMYRKDCHFVHLSEEETITMEL